MASGGRAKSLNTGGIAALYGQIIQSIVGAGQAQGQAYANVGASIGGGISTLGGNIRQDKADKVARADRQAERAENQAIREQERAERRAERAEDKAYRRQQDELELAFKEKALEVQSAKGRAVILGKQAAEAQKKATFGAKMQAVTGQEVPEAEEAKASAQSAMGAFQTLISRLKGQGPDPVVLRPDGMGGAVDEAAPEALYESEQRRHAQLQQMMTAAKTPEDVAALNVALRVTERRLTGLKAAVVAKGEQAKVATAKRAEIEAGQKRNAATSAAMEAVRSTAKALGVSESEAFRYVKGDVRAGATPATIRAALTNRFGAKKDDPTPRQRARYEVDVESEKETARRESLMKRPQQEREDLYEEEYAKEAKAIRSRDLGGDEMESALDALAGRLGRKYGL